MLSGACSSPSKNAHVLYLESQSCATRMSCAYEGWLSKQGGFRGGFKSWRRRWFVLQPDFLSYYKEEGPKGEAGHRGSELLGLLPIQGATLVDLVDADDREDMVAKGERPKPHPLRDSSADCCICGSPATLACPGCGRRLCSSCCHPESSILPQLALLRTVTVCSDCHAEARTWIQRDTLYRSLEKRARLMERRLEFATDAQGLVTTRTLFTVNMAEKRNTASGWMQGLRKTISRPKDFMFALQTAERELWVSAPDRKTKYLWLQHLEHAIVCAALFERSQRGLSILHRQVISAQRPSVRTDSMALQQVSQLVDQAVQWDINPNDLTFGDKVASGKFGDVHKGTLWGTPVAIKVLREASGAKDLVAELRAEVEVLNQLRHPNVILYMGASTQPPNTCIVTEWCERGSLQNMLMELTQPMNVAQLLHIASGIAQGMNYLHSQSPPIIHRDLKSENVLLDTNLNAKVCDFGLSYVHKLASSFKSGKFGVLGTLEWMAPEVIEGDAYGASADVYSFGIVLCELVGRIKPYSDKHTITSVNDIADIVLDEGETPTIPDWTGSLLKGMILKCLSRSPSDRPNFSSLITFLRSLELPLAAPLETKDAAFLKMDVPRILGMLWSPNANHRVTAARELALLGQKEEHSDEPRVAWIPEETRLAMLSRLTTLFSEPNEELRLHSVHAVVALLDNAVPSIVASYRQSLQEEGALKRLLVLLNSNRQGISIPTSRILSILTSDLDSVSQVQFVDLSHAGLNSITALSGGLRGLQRLESMMQEEIESLIRQRDHIEDQLTQKAQLAKRLQVSCSILQTRYRKKANRATTKKIKTMQSHGPSDVPPTLLPRHRFSLYIPQEPQRRMSVTSERSIDSPDTISESLPSPVYDVPAMLQADSIDIIDIPSVPHLPASFEEYYGLGSDAHFGNCYAFNSSLGTWETAFLYLTQRELRQFVTVEDEPDDPLLIVYLDRISGAALQVYEQKPNALVLQADGEHAFCFRSLYTAYQWAHWVAPLFFPTVLPEDAQSPTACLVTPSADPNDQSLLRFPPLAYHDRLMEQWTEAQSAMGLPESFAAYFDGFPITMHGILLVSEASVHDLNDEDPELSPWTARRCLLIQDELKLFEPGSDDPEDAINVVYAGGPFADPKFKLLLHPSYPSILAIQDEASIFILYAGQDRDAWAAAMEDAVASARAS